MGLIYQLPVSEEEKDFVKKSQGFIELKSYGLPPLFWLYLLAIFSFYAFLLLGALGPIKKMASFGGVDAYIAYGLSAFLILLPIATLGFYFYLKTVSLTDKNLKIEHRVFGFLKKAKKYEFTSIDFRIRHELDSPNMARMYPEAENRGFQNKGYFVLEAFLDVATDKEKIIQLDRSSSKSDLKKIILLLQSI